MLGLYGTSLCGVSVFSVKQEARLSAEREEGVGRIIVSQM